MIDSPIRPLEADPDDSPIGWFAEMILALHRGDFRKVAESQDELARLGWTVRYKSHPAPASPARQGGGR